MQLRWKMWTGKKESRARVRRGLMLEGWKRERKKKTV